MTKGKSNGVQLLIARAEHGNGSKRLLRVDAFQLDLQLEFDRLQCPEVKFSTQLLVSPTRYPIFNRTCFDYSRSIGGTKRENNLNGTHQYKLDQVACASRVNYVRDQTGIRQPCKEEITYNDPKAVYCLGAC